jgi:protein TonB
MKSGSSFVAIAATLLLHAALVAAVVAGLSAHQNNPPEPLPIAVQLLAPPPENQPAEPLPAAPSPPPAGESSQPKRVVKPKPVAKPRDAPQAKEPDAPLESKPAQPDTSAQPALPAQAAPAPPAPPAPPVKTGVSIPASYAASNREPTYPALSRRYEEQGTVVLRVLVKADGTAGEVQLKSSSGYPLLDKSAISTVQTWRFHPATSDGKPVAEWYQVSIPFKLRD